MTGAAREVRDDRVKQDRAAAGRTRASRADVAGPAADAVDREGRFPHEAIAALKKGRFLSAFVPREPRWLRLRA